jgi:hypothetical protein
MKTFLTVLFALAAGGLFAQTTPLEPNARAKIPAAQPDNPMGLRPQYAYEVHYRGHTLDGLGVELYKARNPLKLFNPFDPEVRAAAHDNITWDMETGKADGWTLFSLHF